MSDVAIIIVVVAVVLGAVVVARRPWPMRSSGLTRTPSERQILGATAPRFGSALRGTPHVDCKHIVDYPACQGTLTWDENGNFHETAVTFAVEVDRAGEICIIIDDQQLTNENFWINRVSSGSSPVVTALSLEGRNTQGYVLRSDSVHLTAVGTPSTPNSVTLQAKAKAQRLTAFAARDADAVAQEFQAEYWVAGLRWFHGATFGIAEGEVAIGGDVKPDDYSKVTGIRAMRAEVNVAAVERNDSQTPRFVKAIRRNA